MMIFVGNLPPLISEQALAAALRLSQEDARRLRIVRRISRQGASVRYGLLQARTDAQARRLIERSGRIDVEGSRLMLREFYKRIAGNERRSVDWRTRDWPHAERRRRERRNAERLAA